MGHGLIDGRSHPPPGETPVLQIHCEEMVEMTIYINGHQNECLRKVTRTFVIEVEEAGHLDDDTGVTESDCIVSVNAFISVKDSVDWMSMISNKCVSNPRPNKCHRPTGTYISFHPPGLTYGFTVL